MAGMAECRGCHTVSNRAVETIPRGGISSAWWMGYRVVEAMVCGGDIIGWRSIIAPIAPAAACAIDRPSPTPGTALMREFSPRWNDWTSSLRSEGSVSSVVLTTVIVHPSEPVKEALEEDRRLRRRTRSPARDGRHPRQPRRPPHPDRSPARRIAGPSHSPATPGFHMQNRLCACITRGLPDGTPGLYTDWGRFACGTRELPAGAPEVYTRRGRLTCITREYRPVPPPG